jgi:hypothetical protein
MVKAEGGGRTPAVAIFDELDLGTRGSLNRQAFHILLRRATALDNFQQSTEEEVLQADKMFDTIQKKENGVPHM